MMKQKKPVFLYVVIAVLALALVGMGALNIYSLEKLASVQKKVNRLQASVQDISDSSAALSSKADQLDKLYKDDSSAVSSDSEINVEDQDNNVEDSAEASGPSQQTQEEGTLSPSSTTTFTDNTDSSMDTLLNQIQGLLPTDNGNWSVYVCNLAKGTDGSINSGKMQAASLIKLYIMGAVYEDYDSLTSQYGNDALESNIQSMITVSDNDAANTLVTWLGNGDSAAGMARVNQFCQSHGYNDTSMGRMLLASKENGDNYTSVTDCGKFLRTVYKLCNNIPCDDDLAGAEYMYHFLKMQQRVNKIPAQMPEGVKVANKTGELDDVENDVGIIYDTANGIDLVICFMSENLSDTGAAQSTIAQDSRMIYGYYNE